MKRFYMDRVKERAQRYSSLSLYLQRMEQQGVIGALFDSIFIFVRTEKERDQQLQKKSKNFFTQPDKIGSEPELVSFISNEEVLQENIKLILSLLVEDIFRNFHSYQKEKKELGSSQISQVSSNMSQQNNKLLESKNKLKEDLSKQLLKSKLDSNHLNRDFLDPSGQEGNAANLSGRSTRRPQEQFVYNDAIDDSDSDQSSMLRSQDGQVEVDDKENLQVEFNNLKTEQQQVFSYQTAQVGRNEGEKKREESEEMKNRRMTEQPNHQKLEHEYILSQYQTPQYKQSEIGNPISSPNTDERENQEQQNLQQVQMELARTRLQMNLLSQENSAKQELAYQPRTEQEGFEEKKGNMEERMRNNILALEKNPLFSCFDATQLETQLLPEPKNKEELSQKGKAANEAEGRYVKNESGCYIDDGDEDEEGSETHFVTNDPVFQELGSPQQNYPTLEDTMSDGNPSLEAAHTLQQYQTKQGISQKMNKLNFNQLQSQNNLGLGDGINNGDAQNLLMDQQYLKNIPKTGRDHYQNNQPPLHPYTNIKASKLSGPVNQHQNGHNETNSLQLSSEQPTKVSAEEAVRSYLNANFILQKQPKDRMDLLCQSRELNPLVSLSIENQEDKEQLGMRVTNEEAQKMAEIKKGHAHIQSQLLHYEQDPKKEGANTDRSRSKTPLTGRAASQTALNGHQQEKVQGYALQQNKKDNSVIEKLLKEQSLTSKTINSGNSQGPSGVQDGKYLNQLAKVIKTKGSTPQSSQNRVKSRNQLKNAASTTPLPLNQQPPFTLNGRINGNVQIQANISLLQAQSQTQEGRGDENFIAKESSQHRSNGNGQKGQVKNQTKFQQFTLSQRNESQHSQRSSNSGAGGTQKINKFSMRRFTNEASSPINDSALNKMTPTINQSNIVYGIGSSNSNKALNNTSNNLPPQQKSAAQLVQNAMGPQRKNLLTNSPQDGQLQMVKSTGDPANYHSGGSTNSHANARTLKEASSHKNIIQYTSAAQAVLYTQLKKQKKKNE